MSSPATCPTCKSVVPPDSPDGACPRCMLAAGLVAATVPNADEVAAKLPAFEILSLLGHGGMGVVFKARQKTLDRVVALKVLPSAAAAAPGFAERFAREAKAMARLQHPNIVAVHDSGESDGLFWLVMEYVDGVNIREAMRGGRIAPKEALAIVPQICDALQYAHEHGVVHRDIKPENVLLDKSGRVKVADFGLAKMMEHGESDRTLTGAGQVMGTPHYMAPEQVEHPRDVDHRADIYSLGVVFYEMLTGELPLGRFAAPSGKCDVDARIDEIVLRTLAKEREARYQQVSQVKTDMGKAATEPGAKERPKRWRELLPLAPADQAKADRLREGVVGAFMLLVGVNAWLSHQRSPHLLLLPLLAVTLLLAAVFWRFRASSDADAAALAWRRRRRKVYGFVSAGLLAGVGWAIAAPHDVTAEYARQTAVVLSLEAALFVFGLVRRWNMTAVIVVVIVAGFVWHLVVNLSRPASAPLLSHGASAILSADDFRAIEGHGMQIDLPDAERRRIDALWRDVQQLPASPGLEDVGGLYSPKTLQSLRAVPPERLAGQSAAFLWGLPLFPRDRLPRPLSDFRLIEVIFVDAADHTMQTALATASADRVQIRFSFERSGERAASGDMAYGPWCFGGWLDIVE